MGGPFKEELTDEEKAIVGEVEEKKEVTEKKEEGTGETQETKETETQETKETETKETETEQKTDDTQKSEEAKAAEQMGFRLETDDKGKAYVVDDDGTRIPATRWKSLYRDYQDSKREAQTKQEKFDLFRQLGAEEYYRIYPAEKPEGWKPKEERATPVQTGQVDPLKLVFNAQDPNHPYNGITLEQIKEQDPFFANVLYNDWRDAQRAEADKARQVEDNTRAQEASEANSFGLDRANEFISELYPTTKSYDDLTEAQQKVIDGKVTALGEKVVQWQSKTRRLHLSFNDAYKIMTHDESIKKAKELGARSTIDSLTQKKGVASIDTGKGALERDNSYSAMEKWTDDQLMKHIDGLNEAAYKKFEKEAPPAILKRCGL